MNSIRNAFKLAKIAWLVILADKELLMYPVLASLSAILFLGMIAIPTFLIELSGMEALQIAAMFVLYLGLMFILQFFNAALVSSALVRLNGGNPTLKTGFRQAWKRVGLIAKWSIFAATVGMLLSMLRQRAGALGSLFGGLMEMGWNLLSFFVIPILVVEGISPTDALMRSKELLRKTWGEQISANIGFGVVGVILALPLIPLLFVLFTLFPSGMVPFAVAILYLMTLILFTTTLSGIYQAALYLYARDGRIAGEFDEAELRSAFTAR
jgi:hypothetical protein